MPAPSAPAPLTASLLHRELRAAIRAEFPDLGPRDFERARALGRGTSAVAILVRDRVVRLPLAPADAPALAAEARLLAGIEGRVPALPADARPLLDGSGRPLGMTYGYVRGKSAAGLPLRGAARERLARDLGAFLGALHAVPPGLARRLGAPAVDLWRGRYVPLIEECRPHLGGALARELDRAVEAFAVLRAAQPERRVLVHGDVSGEHVLVAPGGALAGVLDFGEAALGDPALDFAGVLNDRRWPFLERVLAHYPREVDAGARQRAAYFIALAPLYEVRRGVREGDARRRARGSRVLRARLAALRREAPQGMVWRPGGP